MAIYDLHRATALPLSTRVAKVLVDGVERAVEWHRARRTRDMLHGLSDEALDDIGLHRADIDRRF